MTYVKRPEYSFRDILPGVENEKEKVATVLNDTLGRMIKKGDPLDKKKISSLKKSKNYVMAKTFLEMYYSDLLKSVMIDLAFTTALNDNVDVNFVAASDENLIVEMEVDYTPKEQKPNDKNVFAIVKYNEYGDKVSEEHFDNEGAEKIKAERLAAVSGKEF